MKKIMVLVLMLGICLFSGKAFGQESKEKEKEKDRKGGYAVGGYDNTRQEQDKVVTKRSVNLPVEGEQAEKAVEAAPQKEDKGNAYGTDKDGLEGKEFGQARSGDAKSKQKAKKEKKEKSKGNRR